MNTYRYVSDNYNPFTLKKYLIDSGIEHNGPTCLGTTIYIQTEADKATLDVVMAAYLAQDNKLIAARVACIETCHQEAEKRVKALIPQSSPNIVQSELNLLMEVALLLRKEASGIATAEDIATLDAAVTIRDGIKAIRAAEATIGVEIEAAVDPCDVLIEFHPSWP